MLFRSKHQTTVVAKYTYGPEERTRLLEKINRLADNLSRRSMNPSSRWGTTTKIIPTKFLCKPLIRFDSDERIQGNPNFSNPC